MLPLLDLDWSSDYVSEFLIKKESVKKEISCNKNLENS